MEILLVNLMKYMYRLYLNLNIIFYIIFKGIFLILVYLGCLDMKIMMKIIFFSV